MRNYPILLRTASQRPAVNMQFLFLVMIRFAVVVDSYGVPLASAFALGARDSANFTAKLNHLVPKRKLQARVILGA